MIFVAVPLENRPDIKRLAHVLNTREFIVTCDVIFDYALKFSIEKFQYHTCSLLLVWASCVFCPLQWARTKITTSEINEFYGGLSSLSNSHSIFLTEFAKFEKSC